MKQILLYGGMAIALLLGGLLACSDNSKVADEKGAIEKATDKVTADAVSKIRTPINRARATQNLGDDRLKAMDEALQKQ